MGAQQSQSARSSPVSLPSHPTPDATRPRRRHSTRPVDQLPKHPVQPVDTTPSLVKQYLSAQTLSELLPSGRHDLFLSPELIIPVHEFNNRASYVSSTDTVSSELFSTVSSYTALTTRTPPSPSCRSSASFPDTGSFLLQSLDASQRHLTSPPLTTRPIPTFPAEFDATDIYARLQKEKTSAARVVVAQCKLHGFGTTQQIDIGFQQLHALAKRRVPEAYYALGACYADGWVPDGQPDLPAALRWFKAAAQDTRLPDLLLTSAMYRTGLLLQRLGHDRSKASFYFEQAAQRNHPQAQYMVGLYHALNGQLQQAQTWYTRSARQGCSDAQAALGILLVDQPQHSKAALHWLQQAADKQHPRALLRLGTLLEEGVLVAQDKRLAMTYYERAVQAKPDDAVANYLVGINYRLGDLDVTPSPEIAMRYLSVSAKAGYPPAQRVLGAMYAERGNHAAAHEWFQRAADQGDILALGRLAEQYDKGLGCTQNLSLALATYAKAAAAGSIMAQLSQAQLLFRMQRHPEAFSLFCRIAKHNDPTCSIPARLMVARYQLRGLGGVARDPALAFHTFTVLAEQEYVAEAYYWMGACYEEGVPFSIPRHPLNAHDAYLKGARLGDVECQFQVALTLSNGIHEPPVFQLDVDHKAAFEWYTKAAQAGHATAQCHLGHFYAKGLPPLTSAAEEQAARWYDRAARQDHVQAMICLGTLLMTKDNTKAFYWLQRAAAKDDPVALRHLAAAYESNILSDTSDSSLRYKIAFTLLEKAAIDKKDTLAWCALSRYYECGWHVNTNIAKAVQCLETARQMGYPKADLALAAMYERQSMWDKALQTYDRLVKQYSVTESIGRDARLAKARLVLLERNVSSNEDVQRQVYEWLKAMMVDTTASETLVEPFELLGVCCEFGKGATKDTLGAVTWYEAALGPSVGKDRLRWIQVRARYRLAKLLLDDPTQHPTCLNHLRQLQPFLDEMNHHSPETRQQARHIRYALGYLLARGQGIDHAVQEAKQWLSQAADEGDGEAAYVLGHLATEDATAIHCFQQGVSAGHAGCMRSLALVLEHEHHDDNSWTGQNTLYLLEQASQLGDLEAIVHLGRAYQSGLGTSVKPGQTEKALSFYLEAASLGSTNAMVKAGELLCKLERHWEAVPWLKRAKDHLSARVILASYRLKGYGGLIQNERQGYAELQQLIAMDNKDLSIDEKHAMGAGWFLIGLCQELGCGTTKDREAACQSYRQAIAIANHIDAMVHLAHLSPPLEALDWYRQAAEMGQSMEAQYHMGLYHSRPLAGLEQNLTAARKYFKKAADQGHGKAIWELGRLYWHQHEHADAVACYQEAAQREVPEALRELGTLYHQGFTSKTWTVARDYKQAFTYFFDAAKKRDAVAALMVGTYFEEGYLEEIGVDSQMALKWYMLAYSLEPSPVAELAIGKLKHTMADTHPQPQELLQEAYTWFVRAASRLESPHAKIMVALYHLNGWGHVERDPPRGFRLLLEIAEAGGSEALTEIARCYEEGIGTHQNYEKALSYWELAADMNDADALFRVAEYHEQGLAGPPDKVLARRYYTMATALATKTHDKDTSTSSSSSILSFSGRSQH